MQGGPRRRASTHSPLPEVAPSGTIVAVVVLSNRMVKSYEDLNAPRRRFYSQLVTYKDRFLSRCLPRTP